MNAEERAAFRAFVRTHHPDRGGDPQVFVEGMARFAGRAPQPPAADDIRTGDRSDARFDAPIEVVAPLSMPMRVAVAMIRTVRWHRQQSRDQRRVQ